MILKIKKIWFKFLNISKSLREEESKKNSYKKYFIQDEEDEELNRGVLNTFDEKIILIKNKRNNLRKDLDKILLKFNFFDVGAYENIIVKCAEYKIKSYKIEFLKDIFKYYIKNYNPSTIITFADRRYSLGKLYPILDFNFHSFTKPSYFYWKSMRVYNRMSFQKHMLKNKLNKFNPELSEYDNMLLNGYNRVWDCGNYKFIWTK